MKHHTPYQRFAIHLGVITGLIGLYVFFTGKASLKDIFKAEKVPRQKANRPATAPLEIKVRSAAGWYTLKLGESFEGVRRRDSRLTYARPAGGGPNASHGYVTGQYGDSYRYWLEVSGGRVVSVLGTDAVRINGLTAGCLVDDLEQLGPMQKGVQNRISYIDYDALWMTSRFGVRLYAFIKGDKVSGFSAVMEQYDN